MLHDAAKMPIAGVSKLQTKYCKLASCRLSIFDVPKEAWSMKTVILACLFALCLSPARACDPNLVANPSMANDPTYGDAYRQAAGAKGAPPSYGEVFLTYARMNKITEPLVLHYEFPNCGTQM